MWATRLQLFLFVSYFFPTICFWANTSYNLNSIEILLFLELIFPATKCCALITFQSSNLGWFDKDSEDWIKAFLSIGINSPDLSKLSDITIDMFLANLSKELLLENKLVTAIGVGLIVPWFNVSSRLLAFKLNININIRKKYFIINN